VLVTGVTNITTVTMSIDLSFVKTDDVAYGPGNNLGGASAYLIETTATARNPTWTATDPGNMASTIASFKAATGGGSTFPPALLNAPIRCCRR
jgi:hypothetical protein